ncbi:hypothetical protein K501DRAFT_305510 [Backusella circina FSU 941]|nr:hypothetical protein K501DRAFT_305510 [Backusella circina FSU 941]
MKKQLKALIGYIVDVKMSVVRVNMTYYTGRRYYTKYLDDPNHNIPEPFICGKRYTQDQINKLIDYIIDGKLSVMAASIKANMPLLSATKYYHKYLNDPNHVIPILIVEYDLNRLCIQDRINKLISYIIDDKLFITVASKKLNMSTGLLENTVLNI